MVTFQNETIQKVCDMFVYCLLNRFTFCIYCILKSLFRSMDSNLAVDRH